MTKGPPRRERARAVRTRRDGREGTYSLWREVLRTGAPSLTGEASIPWSGERRAHRHDTAAVPVPTESSAQPLPRVRRRENERETYSRSGLTEIEDGGALTRSAWGVVGAERGAFAPHGQ